MSGLDRARFRPVLVAPGNGAMAHAARDAGITVYDRAVDWWIRADDSFSMSRLDIENAVVGLLDVIDRERPSIVHTNTSVVISGAIAARRRRLYHVWHLHEVLHGHTELRTVLPLDDVFRVIDGLSDRVVTVSQAQRSECSAIDPSRLCTISNGVYRNVVAAADARTVRNELGVADDVCLVTAVGSIIPRKGHADLIEAAAILRGEGIEARYLIVGNGAEKEVAGLKARASALGVGDIVGFSGFRSDVQSVLAASDVLAQPSRNEALPTAVLEGMAAGLAVVATDCGGTKELVVDGETGFVVPPGRPAEFAHALGTLVRDQVLRRRMGDSGLKRFEDHYSLQAMVGAFERLYTELLESGDAPRATMTSVERTIRSYERAYLWKRAIARFGRMFARSPERRLRS